MQLRHSRMRLLCGPAAILAICGFARAQEDDYAARSSIDLQGTFRQVTPAAAGGHADFGHFANDGAGRYVGVVADTLDGDGLPQFASTGRKVTSPWRDASGTWIMPPRPYLAGMPGDVAGATSAATGGAVNGASSFATWFRSGGATKAAVPGHVQMRRHASEPLYTFEGFLDGGGTLTGGAGKGSHAHTYEMQTTFIHRQADDQYIEVTTDGDVWLFINGRLVIDGGAGDDIVFPGVAIDGSITMENTATIEVGSGNVSVSTNATSTGAWSMDHQSRVFANVFSGPGSNPATVIDGESGRISGTLGALSAPITVPTPTPPALGPSAGHKTFNNTTQTIKTDLHVDNLSIQKSRLIFEGHRSVVVDGDFSITQQSDIEVAPGSSVKFYIAGSVTFRNNTDVNRNTGVPSLCTFIVTGSSPVEVDNKVTIYANFIAPNAPIDIGNNTDVYGALFGGSLYMHNSSKFIMMAPPAGSELVAGVPLNPATAMTQRIHLNRLGLPDHSTAGLKLFFADRSAPASPIRIETNILTLKLAGKPMISAVD